MPVPAGMNICAVLYHGERFGSFQSEAGVDIENKEPVGGDNARNLVQGRLNPLVIGEMVQDVERCGDEIERAEER